MSEKNGRDYLYLIWKSEISRKQYIIGELTKNGQYEFQYNIKEVPAAQKDGFELLVSFPNISETYKSDILFPSFSSRLPDRKRKDIKKILAKYNLEEFDAYSLLKRSGARLPIDNLEFIDPILDINSNFSRIFFMAGTRHYVGCNGNACNNSIKLEKNELLSLQREPENTNDSNAVAIYTKKNEKIGYIPRYYAKAISEILLKGYHIECIIYEINQKLSCHECVKLKIKNIVET